MDGNNPRLFGIDNSNRDFSDPETWGKNQFNSSFPASLACYLFSKGIPAVFLKADKSLNPVIDYIDIDKLFHINPLSSETYYSFESPYIPYQQYMFGLIPRNDLVIQDTQGNCRSSFEIKLTALPDNATCNLSETEYGSEVVIRPDTIVYLACNFIKFFDGNPEALRGYLKIGDNISDWTEAEKVLPYIHDIQNEIMHIVEDKNSLQAPIILEPIWKTDGKSPILSDNCLDVFVWSDIGMLNLFMPRDTEELTKISRHTRTMVWLYKMLYDFSRKHQFNGGQIIDALSYNTKNDKAFSTNGMRTHPFMDCKELVRPRITKSEIKNIILGGGQNLLSPERRFDAIIVNSPDIFEDTFEDTEETQ